MRHGGNWTSHSGCMSRPASSTDVAEPCSIDEKHILKWAELTSRRDQVAFNLNKSDTSGQVGGPGNRGPLKAAGALARCILSTWIGDRITSPRHVLGRGPVL